MTPISKQRPHAEQRLQQRAETLLAHLPSAVVTKLCRIQLLCLDVDGVLTNGQLIYHSDGSESKAFNTQDGHGLKTLAATGIELAIISGRQSVMVERRAAELGIKHLYQDSSDKTLALIELAAATQLDPSVMAHVGDDLPDLALFDRVGCACTVADAHPLVRERADLISTLPGGRGAVRELCEQIMIAQGTWPYLNPA